MVDTPLTESITKNDIVRKASEKMHALQRIGKPKDISNMISFLINSENDWITGQNFIIDGGLSSTK
jgi:NAD(P)-dependent dehydrogenase (short-subunit alcohol dehydrogenase family)